MSATKYFIDPFAVAGDVTAIPNPPQSGGQVSYSQGFGFNYQRNLATDPLALPIPRPQFNQLMNDITTAIQQVQQQGFPNWISSSDNGGSPFSYGLGTTVIYTDGKYYQSNISGNTNTPGDASGAWQLVPVIQQGVAPVICDCASTTSLTLSGVQTIDGVAGVDGVTVVGYFSGTSATNGVYIMRSGAWTRSPYYNSAANIIPGSAVFVRAGTLNGNKYFQLVTAAPLTIGTTALTFSAPTVTIPNSGVTPGSYTYSSITVGADGRVTSASNGTIPTGFGAWNSSSYSVNTVYQASTDGFLVVYDTNTNEAAYQVLTDSANPPTTIRSAKGMIVEAALDYFPCGTTTPIRAGDYFKIVTSLPSYNSANTHIYWLPLGI